jgi:hypothetical protein
VYFFPHGYWLFCPDKSKFSLAFIMQRINHIRQFLTQQCESYMSRKNVSKSTKPDLLKTPTGIKGLDEITEGGLPKGDQPLFAVMRLW